MKKKRHQVVIVGGGPVGVALAVELGQRGISCALVERRLTPQRIPKGQGLTQRTDGASAFLGRCRQGARGAAAAAGVSGKRRHRVSQSHERYLVRAAAARDHQPLLFPGLGAAAAIPDRGGAARADGGAAHGRERVRLGGAGRRPRRALRPRDDRQRRHRRARDPGGRLRGGLRRRTLDRARADRHCPRRHRFRPAHGARGDPLARAARGLQALPAAHDLPRAASRSQGLLDVLRPGRRGRGILLPRAGAAGHDPRQLRFPRPDAARRRVQLRLRIRLCRLLGPAHRGGRDLPGRPRLHRRRRRTQSSALRRLWAQQRARRRHQSRLEARRPAERMGQRRAAGIL